MPKKLVVCCDGTWNTPRTGTNIYRTYNFLWERLGRPTETTDKQGTRRCSGKAPDGTDVALYYDEGVGTQWFDKLLGGSVGAGLSDNVRAAYRFLGDTYEPGAEIYLFGFSRGAYTARSLCGFIKAAGLLVKPSVQDVWRAYMDRYVAAQAPAIAARSLGFTVDGVRDWFIRKGAEAVGHLGGTSVDRLPTYGDVAIKLIGVYDTVGALGVPIPLATKLNEPIVGFHDTTLGRTVQAAVQALAVDEKRGPYSPALWTQAANAQALAGQSVLQVWFPGVHSDIGGGYGDDKGIGDITWDFMMRQAAAHGLVVDPAQPTPALTLNPLPAQHDSFDKAWQELSSRLKLIPENVRAIGPTTVGPSGEQLTVSPKVLLHPCLVNRLGQRCTTIVDPKNNVRREGDYLPTNVKADTLPPFA